MEKIIIINGEMTFLPDNILTVKDLLDWKNVKQQGTAVAINGNIIPALRHSVTILNNKDTVMIISAAYGG